MNRYNRPIGMLLLILLLCYFSWPMGVAQMRAWIARYQSKEVHHQPGSLINSLVYPVKPGQWITFNIPEGSRQLRVISNAHIQIPEPSSTERPRQWKYRLHYQLVDQHGVVLEDGLYHHRSQLSRYHDASGKRVYENFYVGYSQIPLDGRLMLLAMPVVGQAATIRISLVQQSPEISEVAVRFYVPVKLSEQRLASMWLRMNNRKKQLLADNSVYPAALLTETEKRNLLKHQWQAQGPTGIDGEDYRALTLYIRRELEPEKRIDPVIATGLQIDAHYPGIIPIPEQGGDLTITLSKPDGSILQEALDFQLQWFGRLREQRWKQLAQWSSDTKELKYPVEGGLLKISALQPLLVRAFLASSAQPPVEITPSPLRITAYQANTGVDYEILHIDNQPTAVRVDIRGLFDADVLDRSVSLDYQWLDSQQQLLKQDVLTTVVSPSHYDRVIGRQQQITVSDPVRYFFNIPAQVSILRLVSRQTGVLVNAYNQPQHFQKVQQIPENTYISLDRKNGYPSWFRMQPVNHQSLVKHQALKKIAAQYRTPEDKSALQTDQYRWQAFKPSHSAETRSILIAMNNTTGYRDQALASVFCQILPNRVNTLELGAYGNLPGMTAQLIYTRSSQSAFHVHVSHNGQQIIDSPAIGRQGLFSLANLPSGHQSIQISTNAGGQWYLNHVRNCPSQRMIKKRVFKLSRQPLRFDFFNDQQQDKVFSGRFYTADENSKRFRIQVSIEALQRQPVDPVKKRWTFTRRLYDIRPSRQQSALLLYSHGRLLNRGERFFIPFNNDLPVGRYRITVRLTDGAEGYLGLSVVKPGVDEQLYFYRETNDQVG